jgi:hypothetical protein
MVAWRLQGWAASAWRSTWPSSRAGDCIPCRSLGWLIQDLPCDLRADKSRSGSRARRAEREGHQVAVTILWPVISLAPAIGARIGVGQCGHLWAATPAAVPAADYAVACSRLSGPAPAGSEVSCRKLSKLCRRWPGAGGKESFGNSDSALIKAKVSRWTDQAVM